MSECNKVNPLPPLSTIKTNTQNPFHFLAHLKNQDHKDYYSEFLMKIVNNLEKRLNFYIENGESIMIEMFAEVDANKPKKGGAVVSQVSQPDKEVVVEVVDPPVVTHFGSQAAFQYLLNKK